MINLYRIDHIAQAVTELESQVGLLEKLFGCRRLQAWENREAGFRAVSLSIPGTHGTRWEVLAPLDEASPLNAFIEGPRGPGLHHIAAEVTDFDATLAALDRLGVKHSVAASGRYVDAVFGPPEGPAGMLFRLYATPHLGCCGQGAEAPPSDAVAGEHTLGIDGLLHVCQAHSDRDALSRWYEQAVGMREIYRTPDGAWPDMATLMLSVPASQLIWEVIQPEGEDSHVERFLDRKGAGCHHLTLEVRDRERSMAACEHHQVPTFGLTEGETDGARWCDFFIHPKQTGGVLVQLYWEERPGVWARSDKIPSPR